MFPGARWTGNWVYPSVEMAAAEKEKNTYSFRE
jgi:hypothetical protein